MTNSDQYSKISGVQHLSEETLQNLASSLSPNEEFFSQEEIAIREKISKASSKKAAIKAQIDNLEVVEHPGIKPNREKINDSIKSIFGVWFGLVVLMFIIHCIMWCVRLVSHSSWDTWKWTTNLFLYGLLICIIAYLGIKIWYHFSLIAWETSKELYTEYKDNVKKLQKSIEDEDQRIRNYLSELEKIEKNRARILIQAYRANGLPLKSLEGWNYKDAKSTFFSFLDLMHKAYKDKNLNEIMSYINIKYELFYTRSLASEATSNEILQSFRKSIPLYQSGKVNREMTTPDEVTKYAIDLLSTRLNNYMANGMDQYINDFDQILEMDTSGYLTKHDSSLLEAQTEKFQSVYNRSARFVEGFQHLSTNLNNALGICRLVAFRNIYLGAELLNITHRGAGGGKSTTSTDNISDIEFANLKNIDISSFSLNDSINTMVSSGLENMSNFISSALSQKNTRKYVVNNPKAAALTAAGAAVFGVINAGIDAWKKRNEKINDLINKQEQIYTAMEQLLEAYESNYPLAVRSFELIEAITKINKGFVTMYKPIYDKIFIQQNIGLVSKQELHGLARALNEYNNIAKTKL